MSRRPSVVIVETAEQDEQHQVGRAVGCAPVTHFMTMVSPPPIIDGTVTLGLRSKKAATGQALHRFERAAVTAVGDALTCTDGGTVMCTVCSCEFVLVRVWLVREWVCARETEGDGDRGQHEKGKDTNVSSIGGSQFNNSTFLQSTTGSRQEKGQRQECQQQLWQPDPTIQTCIKLQQEQQQQQQRKQTERKKGGRLYSSNSSRSSSKQQHPQQHRPPVLLCKGPSHAKRTISGPICALAPCPAAAA